ncbi:hypothetical protein [Enhygromyxa salina]|nr:hypothetical protein [Enhygromyxa salina]
MAAAAFAGAAGLACETAWTRLLALALGHEQLGVLSVLAGFFGGMALGAGLAHARADSLRTPARSFALLQVGVAVYAIASPWLLTWFGAWLPGALGLAAPTLLSVVAAAVILAPATLALGASLPLLVAARRRVATDDARGLARLYALDTIGATVGVLAMIHLLLPALGVALATGAAAALALVSAGLAIHGQRRNDEPAPASPVTREQPARERARDPDDGLLRERWILYVAIGVTGLLGLGLEVIGVRVLAQVFSGTIYSFADLLAVWLLGTGVGAGCHAWLSARALGRRPATVLVGLLWALAVSVALTAMLAKAAPELLALLGPTSGGWGRRQLAELATAGIVLGPTTILMGACFAHLLALIAAPDPDPTHTPAGPRPIGLALAINGLAAAAAPIVVGLWAMGSLTYAEVWASIAWGYLLLAAGIAWLRRLPPRVTALGSIVGGLTLLGAGAGSLVLAADEDPGDAWTILERREGPLGVVGVSRSTQPPGSPERPLLRLRVDRQFRMGGALSIGERRMGHVSMLLAGPEARAAVFLGLGTGATAGAGLSYPLTQLTGVELLPEVIELLPHFAAVNAGLATDPRARLLAVDARRFLRADPGRHDLIVADLFHPARDGAGSLYAREQFTAARERLSTGGLFVQWLPLYQLDWASLQMITQTFVSVFPQAHAMLALYNAETPALGLIGSDEVIQIDLAQLEAGLANPAREAVYLELALTDPRDFLAGYMLDRAGLLELAGDAPINDDLHPRVELWAPRAKLGPLTGADNLERLLGSRRAWPDGFMTDPDPAKLARFRSATASFADALAHYLAGEIALRRQLAAAPSSAPMWTRALAAPYLAAYLREPAFLPARPRLYAAAEADPALAEWLLPAMIQRTPAEPRAHQAWLAHLVRINDQARLDAATAVLRELATQR